MAAPKTAKTKTPSKSGGMMGMVSKALSLISIILATMFFSAMFDVGHMNLLSTFAGMANILVPLFAVLSIAAMLLTPKSGADAAAIANAAKIAELMEFQSKATAQILTLQNQIDSFKGQDNETLRERNKELQEQLDAIHQVEREKVDGQIEALRQRNEELEEQIKKWAIEAVGKTISGEQAQPMKAA